MEPTSFSNSATNIVNHSAFRRRGVPDVPEDVDFIMEHLNDPNFDYHSELQSLSDSSTDVLELEKRKVSDTGSVRLSEFDVQSRSESLRYSTTSETQGTAFDYDDESPYPEVRAAVSSVDDTTMPVNTFRTWFLGLFYALALSALNQIFSLRFDRSAPWQSPRACSPYYPISHIGLYWSLNPGPFNIKEHVLITVMANVAASGAYATDVIATQRFFYNQTLSRTYEILLVLSSQLICFALGGFLRRFLVYPSSMIWPGALVNSALFNTLHRAYGKPDHRHISREKFFAIVLACSALWYLVPGYLWTGLSVFNWVCWIAPNNVAVNTLFGTSTGLGMGILTFDWSQVSYFSNPLISPWWSEANTGVGFVFCFWILAPILYYTNSFYTSYLPMSAPIAFDNTGMAYDPVQVVTNGAFDVSKYEAYSPAFLPATLAIAYGVAFAGFTSVIVHTLLWYRRDIMKRFRSNLKDERDIHSRLMQAYPEVPQWWYASLGITMLILLFVTVEVYPTDLPIWGVCVALVLAALVSIPVGMIQAITNQQVALNVMFELLAGYILPGKPVALMIFKTVSYAGTNQAVGFAGDLKLGHYMKIPPRLMFTAQVVAAFVSAIVVTLVQDWMFANIVDICQPNQPQFFTCPSTAVFATSSLIWGGIGPQRLFSPGTIYSPLLWFFFVGAVLPIPFYYLARRFPLSYYRYVNIPVIFAGISSMPPATGINYSSWLTAGFLFQWFMRRYHFRWWMRYNYILAAGLDAGVAFGLLFIFFILQLPKGGFTLHWWGNTAWQNTADFLGTPFRVMPTGQTFGPSTW
ncbi:OPT oligopeptide transporter [Boletus reticuloceps]|uniref:OPT oligopeptide transporter n=1 Tax=Boletus reticuloceps TaxID=495285 RepID=A0A8I2YGK5_9AGAM|nr:OPT oligopeptide transporter [Boletus reticuloceps]